MDIYQAKLGKDTILNCAAHYERMVAEGRGKEAALEYLRRSITVIGWGHTCEAMDQLLQEAEVIRQRQDLLDKGPSEGA